MTTTKVTLPDIDDAVSLQVMDPVTGLVVADIWWDGRSEQWLVDPAFDPDKPLD